MKFILVNLFLFLVMCIGWECTN